MCVGAEVLGYNLSDADLAPLESAAHRPTCGPNGKGSWCHPTVRQLGRTLYQVGSLGASTRRSLALCRCENKNLCKKVSAEPGCELVSQKLWHHSLPCWVVCTSVHGGISPLCRTRVLVVRCKDCFVCDVNQFAGGNVDKVEFSLHVP